MGINIFKQYSSVLGVTAGESFEERLLSSKTRFIRGQDEISIYENRGAGRFVTPFEIFVAYGREQFLRILSEISDRGSAIIVNDKEEPSRSLHEKRMLLGVTSKEVASKLTSVAPSDVSNAEDAKQRTPIRMLEDIAQILDTDSTCVTIKPHNVGDRNLGIRLKTTREGCKISASDVLAFSEASWILKTQLKIASWIGAKPLRDINEFPHDDYYYGIGMPAWQRGYDLAIDTRKKLGFNDEDSINLKDLCEKIFLIPVIQTHLSKDISGATIASNGMRGIVLNINGPNTNPLVRRVTLAHELGHLLYDRDERLETLSVHKYNSMERKFSDSEDAIEQRARAFSVEFLAPHNNFKNIIHNGMSPQQSIRCVMDNYCTSFSSAKLHLWHNSRGIEVEIPWEVRGVDPSPSDECKVSQNFTLDYFPIESTPPQRVGQFASYVARAYLDGYISEDTGANYLRCECERFIETAETIAEL